MLLAFLVAQSAITLGRRDSARAVSAPRPRNWKAALLRARSRSATAVGLGTVVLIVLVLVPYPPGWLRAGVLVAPLLAVGVGLAAFALFPLRRGADPEMARVASGRAFAFVTPGYAGTLIGTFLALVTVVVIMGIVGGSDPDGRWGRGLHLDREGAVAVVGHFPGWFYGIPVLVAAAGLAAACAAALRRVGVTPSLPGAGLSDASRRWSIGTARVIVLTTLAALFLEMAALLFMAMSSARGALETLGEAAERPWWMTALAQIVVAAGFAAFGCLSHALYNSVTLPQRTAAALVAGDEGVGRP